MTLTVEVRRPVAGQPALVSCIGTDDRGGAWTWIAGANEVAAERARLDLPAQRLLRVPAGMPRDVLLEVLSDWPAWQVSSLAAVEIGSRVLVWGESWLAERVLRLLRLRGCLWRAVAEG
jgi:hypothetical protein